MVSPELPRMVSPELQLCGGMGENDIMIAAIALSLGNTTVVTIDSDVAVIPGPTVEN
jgi:tRNA(fMet)-specific endonuclease VapC